MTSLDTNRGFLDRIGNWTGLRYVWRRVAGTKTEQEAIAPTPSAVNHTGEQDTRPAAPTLTPDIMAAMIATITEFKNSFGPGAEKILATTLHGENSPLVGQFRPPAHAWLDYAIMSVALGKFGIEDQEPFDDFFAVLAQQTSAGMASPDPAKVNPEIMNTLKKWVIRNVRAYKNFHETFANGAEETLNEILFGESSPLHGQFRPDAKPYLLLAAMHALLGDTKAAIKHIALFHDAIDRQKTSDQTKDPAKRIKAEPVKISSRMISERIILAKRKIPRRPPKPSLDLGWSDMDLEI